MNHNDSNKQSKTFRKKLKNKTIINSMSSDSLLDTTI